MSDSSNRVQVSSGSMGFAGVLTIVFIVLKLTHNVKWSWWWVLSPIWISAAAFVALLMFIVICYTIYKVVKK